VILPTGRGRETLAVMAIPGGDQSRLTAPNRALALLLALLVGVLPLAALLQAIAGRLPPDPPETITRVAFVPLPPPEVTPAPPLVIEAEPVSAAPAPIVSTPAGHAPIATVPVAWPALPASAGTGVAAEAGDSAAPIPAAPAARPASPPERDSVEGRLFPASWAEAPSQRLLGKHNPPRARYERVTGSALLACHVLPSRRLADCKVLRETPEGYGFGKAALGASADFRVNPPMLDGEVVAQGWVAIPVGFANRKPNIDY
jgi:protein TonB